MDAPQPISGPSGRYLNPQRIRWVVYLGLPLLSLLMHIHIFQTPLQGTHAWRQCETASNVDNFAAGDMNIMQPQVYSLEWEDGLKRMEFPLMQWVMAVFYRLFGENVIWLRLVSWLIGLAGVWGFFHLCRRLFQDETVALAGAWIYSFSPVFFYYTMNPLPDNLALAATVWGMLFFICWYRDRKMTYVLWMYAFFGLATAVKLPFVLFFGLPWAYSFFEIIKTKGKSLKEGLQLVLPAVVFLVLPGLWYAWVIPTWHGNGVVKGIMHASAADIPEILDIFLHNLVSTLPELMVNYGAMVFFLLGFGLFFIRGYHKHRLAPAFISLGLAVTAYFIFEINMIGKQHDYYLFPFLPCLYLIVTLGFREMLRIPRVYMQVAALCMLFLLPALAGLRTYSRWSSKGFPDGLLAHRTELRAATPPKARVLATHDLSPHIFLYHLQRQGWSFDAENIDGEWISEKMEKGASYLYCSRRAVETHPAIQPRLGEMVLERGDIRVWKLVE